MTGEGSRPAGTALANRRLASARRAALMAASAGCLVALVTVTLCWWRDEPSMILPVAAWNLLPYALMWLALARIIRRPCGWLAGAAGFAAMAAGQVLVLYGAVIQILLARGYRFDGVLAEPLYPLTLLYAPLFVGAVGVAALAVAMLVDARQGRAGD